MPDIDTAEKYLLLKLHEAESRAERLEQELAAVLEKLVTQPPLKAMKKKERETAKAKLATPWRFEG